MTVEKATKQVILKTSYGTIKEGTTLEQVYNNKNLLSIFEKVDTNGDKKISAEEIYTYKGINISEDDQNFYPGLTLDKCKSRYSSKFRELDGNNDKTLSEKEVKIGIIKEKIKELKAIRNYDESEVQFNKLKYYHDLSEKRGKSHIVGGTVGFFAGGIAGMELGLQVGGAIGSFCPPAGVIVGLGIAVGGMLGGIYGGASAGAKISKVDNNTIDKMIQDLENELKSLEN